jgi:hypothetical protein
MTLMFIYFWRSETNILVLHSTAHICSLYSDTDKIRLLNNDNKMYPKNNLYISLQIPKINLLPTDLYLHSWLKQLVAGLSPWRLWFAPRSVHVGFVVDKVALG